MSKLGVVVVQGCNQVIDLRTKSGCDLSLTRTRLYVFFLRYRDGVQWHDMPCYFRSKIICEDSDLQMNRIKKEMGVDVSIPITSDNF